MGGGGCGASANEYSYAHCTWSPNRLGDLISVVITLLYSSKFNCDFSMF
jgi:hypothetical protein